ncbi:hypothetical protein ACERIT_05610 [Halopenitus sp. H-Gu1]|uniref:DUF7854 family protein n=1 Tax=Halopenitus sp. H-Gu1 TaxID=3242697 RepID=UPI00359CC879
MDRISAIRNLENALRKFDHGEASLEETERRAIAVLRTYATEFEGTEDVYRATGPDPIDGTVVVAPSKAAARDRIEERLKTDPTMESDGSEPDVDLERL